MSGTSMRYRFWSQVAVTLFHYSSLHHSLLSCAYFTYLAIAFFIGGTKEKIVAIISINYSKVKEIPAK